MTINPGGVTPDGRYRKVGLRSRAWTALREFAELLTGRSWLWRWMWDREFASLLRDRDAGK